MAGNMIVIGSKFRPFTYDEMIKPIQLADAEHKAIESEVGTLAERAGVLENLANEQTDPESYKMYKNYADDLAGSAAQLASQGLTPGARQNLLRLKKGYSENIIPIENAYKRRDELTKEQRDAMLKDPTLLMSRAASTISLDELVANPSLTYQAYSGNMLTQQAAQAAKELSKYQQEKPREWRKILGGQYFETMMNRGYTPEQVVMAALNDPNAPKELRKIADDVYSSSGIDNWGDELTKQRAKEFIGRGLYSAIGDTQYQQVQNQEYLNPLERRKLKALEAQQNPDKPYRSIPRTSVKGSNTSKLQADIDFLKSVKENPDLLKEKSTRSIFKEARAYGTTWGSYGMQEEYMPNVERIKAITSKYGTTDPDVIIAKLSDEIRKSAIRENSYIVDITDPTLISKNIRENSLSLSRRGGSTGIYELDDNKKGDPVDSEDVIKYFNNKSQIEYEPGKGIVVTGIDDKGKTKSFLLDPEIVTGRSLDIPGSGRINAYQHIMNIIDEGIEEDDPEKQEFYIDLLMKDIYSQFNSISKKQGLTLSSKEE